MILSTRKLDTRPVAGSRLTTRTRRFVVRIGILLVAVGLVAALGAPATADQPINAGLIKALVKANSQNSPPPGGGGIVVDNSGKWRARSPQESVSSNNAGNFTWWANPQNNKKWSHAIAEQAKPPVNGSLVIDKAWDFGKKKWVDVAKKPGGNEAPKPPGDGSDKDPYNPFEDPIFWAEQVNNLTNALGSAGQEAGSSSNGGGVSLPPNALPSNPLPPSEPIRIVNPEASLGIVRFAVNGQIGALPPGEFAEIPRGPKWVIEFDRGGQFGKARYALRSGIYRFDLTNKGWELYHEPGT
jgi:hypothetical protein